MYHRPTVILVLPLQDGQDGTLSLIPVTLWWQGGSVPVFIGQLVGRIGELPATVRDSRLVVCSVRDASVRRIVLTNY